MKKTPAQYLRIEAKRFVAQFAKRPADQITLAQEEIMEQWLSLARWAEQWPAHLPHDLCSLADTVIQRRWNLHNDPDTMLRELSYVDMSAALRGACYCVLLVLAEWPVGYDVRHAHIERVTRAVLSSLEGNGSDALIYERSDVFISSGVLALVSAFDRYRTPYPHVEDDVRMLVRDCMGRLRYFGLTPSKGPKWHEYDSAVGMRQRRLCREIREHIPCPPASEWVRAEMEKEAKR